MHIFSVGNFALEFEEDKTIGHAKAIIALARKIATIIWNLITKDEMYGDKTGYVKGDVQRRKIVETETFSVDERITIISGIIAITGKRKGRVRDEFSHHGLSCQEIGLSFF